MEFEGSVRWVGSAGGEILYWRERLEAAQRRIKELEKHADGLEKELLAARMKANG